MDVEVLQNSTLVQRKQVIRAMLQYANLNSFIVRFTEGVQPKE